MHLVQLWLYKIRNGFLKFPFIGTKVQKNSTSRVLSEPFKIRLDSVNHSSDCRGYSFFLGQIIGDPVA